MAAAAGASDAAASEVSAASAAGASVACGNGAVVAGAGADVATGADVAAGAAASSSPPHARATKVIVTAKIATSGLNGYAKRTLISPPPRMLGGM
ncbi:MAG: hypothetical protein MK035_00950 [Dehalococcoidia bacterium]|nr:hypothetical protein [Dehalococcoidia bacterium]